MDKDTIFEMGTSNLRFGTGSTHEVGMDLDDLGINLKPARAMGMTTIKVLNEDQLLTDLQSATGWQLTA